MLIIADSGFTGGHEVFKFVKLKFFQLQHLQSGFIHLVLGEASFWHDCLKICNGNLLSMKKKWFLYWPSRLLISVFGSHQDKGQV